MQSRRWGSARGGEGSRTRVTYGDSQGTEPKEPVKKGTRYYLKGKTPRRG